ncbi:hypothetical protein ACLPHM_15020 [Paenalcaligenes sp. Me131]|uniref:hypothetical protein n=1 Tax=Paenalcaligenes sp. Me131 TaxID=3392636 RepID=UPI003D2D7D2E
MGCSTTYTHSKKEQIQLTAWGEDNDAIHMMADPPPAYSFAKAELLPLLVFLETPLGQKIAHCSAIVEVFTNQAAKVRFFLYIPATDLSEEDKSVLLSTYQFEIFKPDAYSFVRNIPALAKALVETDTLYIKQWRVEPGAIVKDAPSMTAMTMFAEPIDAELRYMESELRMTPNLVESIMWAPFMLPLLPLGALSQ